MQNEQAMAVAKDMRKAEVFKEIYMAILGRTGYELNALEGAEKFIKKVEELYPSAYSTSPWPSWMKQSPAEPVPEEAKGNLNPRIVEELTVDLNQLHKDWQPDWAECPEAEFWFMDENGTRYFLWNVGMPYLLEGCTYWLWKASATKELGLRHTTQKTPEGLTYDKSLRKNPNPQVLPVPVQKAGTDDGVLGNGDSDLQPAPSEPRNDGVYLEPTFSGKDPG